MPKLGLPLSFVRHFSGAAETVELVLDAEPDHENVHVPTDYDEEDIVHEGANVTWLRHGSRYLVLVPVHKVLFMEGNMWNIPHAAALLENMQRGERALMGAPTGRFYRIDKADVKRSRKWYDENELEYQMSMEEPWSPKDAGTFYVQLLDGNHRAAAAIAAGEDHIPVIVGENYREHVRANEWL